MNVVVVVVVHDPVLHKWPRVAFRVQTLLELVEGGQLGELTHDGVHFWVVATGAGRVASGNHIAVVRVLVQSFVVVVVVAAEILHEKGRTTL